MSEYYYSALNFISEPGGIRTPNQQNRNLSFYPVELRVQLFFQIINFCYKPNQQNRPDCHRDIRLNYGSGKFIRSQS